MKAHMIQGIIARFSRAVDNTPLFAGRIHCFDSDPPNLGKALWNLYDFFKNDDSQMLTTLIDAHPSGWRSIVKADFASPYISYDQRVAAALKSHKHWTEIPSGPECLCHPHPPQEPARLYTNLDLEVQWAYVFDNSGFVVLQSDGAKWEFSGRATWGQSEPNWTKMLFSKSTPFDMKTIEPPNSPNANKTKTFQELSPLERIYGEKHVIKTEHK